MEAVIFDFDGTLADTLPICYAAFQEVFQKYDGKSLSDAEVRAMFGPSETDIIKENLLDDNKAAAIELYYEIYASKHDDFVKRNGEIIKLLAFLKEKDIQIAIVTGKARRSLEISLQALEMDGFFEVMITGDDVEQAKPHPEGVFKALEKMDVRQDQAIFVGDSDADIEAGKRASVHTVGVHWLEAYQTASFNVAPDAYFTDVVEFYQLIG